MKWALKLCTGAACYAAMTGAAFAADCDFSYEIQEGDTLPSIAQTAYGTTNYDFIFLRNPSLAGNIGSPPVGEVIIMPCIPGSLEPDAEALTLAMGAPAEAAPEPEVAVETQPDPVEEVVAETPAEEEPAPEAAPEPAPRAVTSSEPVELRILTASDMPVYSSPDSREGGMVTELLRQALDTIGQPNYLITNVDFRASHPDALLIDGPYDIGYPWARPACDELESLREIAPEEAYLCENFEFSEPFYEYVNGFFVRAGEYTDTRTSFTDFAEARICRPFGGSTSDLAVKGIVEDEYTGATIIRPSKMANCLALLMKGDIDAISGEVFELENAAVALGISDRIQELPALSVLWTIHAIAPKSKPTATGILGQIDEALIDQKISGGWFRVVSRHLALN